MLTTLTATYTGPTAIERTLLEIRQGEWSRYLGVITKDAVARWLRAAVSERNIALDVDCGMSGGSVLAEIDCYPLVAGLDYTLYASWGNLSRRSVAMVEIVDEQVQFRLTDTATTDFPARSIKSVRWTDDCLDQAGNVVAPPVLWVEGDGLRSAAPVYGTATVHYVCERHRYILTVPRRDEALDNHFSAVVAAAIPGYAPVYHVLTLPDFVSLFEADPDARCGGGGGRGSVTGDQTQPVPPSPSGADLITEVDYCSQETVREWTR
jgi:hypothetical protein